MNKITNQFSQAIHKIDFFDTRKKSPLFLVLLSTFCLNTLFAQLPNSQVFHCEYKIISDSLYVSDIKWLTAFNAKGYNNQADFTSDNDIMLSSNWQNEEQTDILQMHLGNRELSKFTATIQSEYSPTLMPNKKEISVIRVQENGDQVLWKYPLDRSKNGAQIINGLKTVGYHTWFHSGKLAMFLVGEPHTLVIEDLVSNSRKQIDDKIGRTLLIRSGKLYYVKKESENRWLIKSLHPLTNQVKTVIEMPKGCEDFVIIPDGTFLLGDGAKMKAYHPLKHDSWVTVADFKALGWNNITRMKVRKNKLLLINLPNGKGE